MRNSEEREVRGERREERGERTKSTACKLQALLSVTWYSLNYLVTITLNSKL